MSRAKQDAGNTPAKGRKSLEKEPKTPSAPVSLKERNASPTLEGPATSPNGPALLHQNLAILEGVSETILEEALASTALKDMVVRRLSPSVIVVDQHRIDEITKFLSKRGYEPKVIKKG